METKYLNRYFFVCNSGSRKSFQKHIIPNTIKSQVIKYIKLSKENLKTRKENRSNNKKYKNSYVSHI